MDGYELSSYFFESANHDGYNMTHEVLGELFSNLLQNDIITSDVLKHKIDLACMEWDI